MSFTQYVKRIGSGGVKSFFKKLVNSSFGYKTIRRVVGGKLRRIKVIKKIADKKNPYIETRKDLVALLGAPALLLDLEIQVLEKYTSLASKVIVEIGSAFGASSLLFLLQKKNGCKIFSIDPFIKDSMGDFQASKEDCFQKVSKAILDIGLGERINDWKLISDYSFNVVKDFNESIDLIFIDGDHRYEAVKKDFDDWFPKVNTKGYILFHDSARPQNISGENWHKGWPGPSRLVYELKQKNNLELMEQVESVSVFRKK